MGRKNVYLCHTALSTFDICGVGYSKRFLFCLQFEAKDEVTSH